MTLPRIAIPFNLPTLCLLAGAYLLIGLVGHAPWKADDAIGIGIMHQMLGGSGLDNWLVPRLAGERYLEDGPLYYALAAACAKIFSALLGWAPHDGARLASALCVGAALWLTRLASRQLHSRHEADNAALVLMGTLGLFVHAHEVLAENGALAGAALGWYALMRATRGIRDAGPSQSTALRNALVAASIWGAGATIIAWSKGPVPMLPLIAAILAAPLCGPTWRSRAWLGFTGLALVIAIAAMAMWLVALHLDHASLPTLWWESQLGSFARPTPARALEQAQLLSWASWPAWPLAAWALWEHRRRLRDDDLSPVALGVLTAGLLFVFTANVSEVSAMPLFTPLALLAGAGVLTLRRAAANAMLWFGSMTFTLLASLVWLGWFAMMTGVPRQIALNFAKLEPGHVPQFGALAFGLALALTGGWLWLLFRSQRSGQKSVPVWAAGITLLWGLVMSLWLPWIDYGKTYAPVSASLIASIRKEASKPVCIASLGLGEAQRAAFHYHAGIVTRRFETQPETQPQATCPLLLVQAASGDTSRQSERIGPGWHRVWEGNRPRDRERYTLYRRDPSLAPNTLPGQPLRRLDTP